jgi:hypothetical protein
VEWANSMTRPLVSSVDPTFARTVLVSTKFDNRVKVELFSILLFSSFIHVVEKISLASFKKRMFTFCLSSINTRECLLMAQELRNKEEALQYLRGENLPQGAKVSVVLQMRCFTSRASRDVMDVCSPYALSSPFMMCSSHLILCFSIVSP